MVLATIIIVVILLLCWLLLSVLEIKIDTGIPQVSIQWVSIGKAILVYEKETWWLEVSILFFHRRWMAAKLFAGNKKIQQPTKKKGIEKNKKVPFSKLINLLRSFRVAECKIALDTGDYVLDAWLYPLNFYRYSSHTVFINFMDENYLILTARNAPWRMIRAWIK